MTASGSWSLGVLIGLPIAAVIVLVFIAAALLLFRWYSRNPSDYDAGFVRVLGWGAVAGVVVTLIATAWAFYPYQSDYHRWQDKTGTVADLSSRFLTEDKSVNQKFVVRFSDGQEYGCNDTRCSLVKVGDVLTLSCKRSWQFTGRDGWDCNYVGRAS